MKRILLYVITLSLPFFFAEALVRTYFAIQIGPSTLLYGTMFSLYQERFDPKGTRARAAMQEGTVSFHENVNGTYSKYYPNQRRNDRDELGNRIDVRINSRGFRGKEFKLEKEAGVIRVVTLGASSTFGFKEHDDRTYPAYMEEMLNREIPRLNERGRGSEDRRIRAFEVINLGIPHLRSGQIYSLFVNEGLALQADFVTFYEGINDAAWLSPPSSSTEQTKMAVKGIPFANEIFRELRFRLLSVALIGTMISQETGEYASEADVDSLRLGKAESFIRNLQELREACRKHGIQLVVGSQQVTGREGRKHDRQAIQGVTYEAEQALVRKELSVKGRISTVEAFFLVHDELMEAEKRWASANRVPYADVISAMNPNREVLVSWVHLNAAGNRIVASAFSQRIVECIQTGTCPDWR